MPSPKDPRGGLTQERLKPEARQVRKPEPKATPELRSLDRGRAVSPELAAQLQTHWGNQAVAQLVDPPGAAGFAASATEIRDGSQDEEEQADRAEGAETERRAAQREQGGGRTLAASRGLPEARSGAAGPAAELDYGGDDDEPLPAAGAGDGTALGFDRTGQQDLSRHRLRRSRSAQAEQTVAEVEENLSRSARALSTGQRGAHQPLARTLGDAVFRAPLEAWDAPALLAGRGCGPEDLEGLAGPFDALGRPIAAARFVARHATRPLALGLARLTALAPGTLLPPIGGLTGAAARMGALASLALAAEGSGGGVLRDRATRTALAEAAVEAALEAAGPRAAQVPPAHVLFQRVIGRSVAGSAPAVRPGPTARRWIGAALRQVAQVAPLPDVPPPPVAVQAPAQDPDDPAARVDTALDGTAPVGERAPHGAAEAQPLLHAIGALLAAGGRAQVELAAAALASRRPAFDSQASAALRAAYQAFKQEAATLVALRAALAAQPGAPPEAAPSGLEGATAAAGSSRERLHAAREACLDALTAIAELG